MRFETSEKYVLGKMLEETAQKRGDSTYFSFEGKQITYGEVYEKALRVATGLSKRGVQKGSHVAIRMENCPEFIYSWFGFALLGAIEAPFNPFHKGNILEYLINYSDAEILILSNSFVDEVKAIEDRIKNIKRVIIEGPYQQGVFKRVATEPFASLLESPANPPRVEVKHNDIMSLMFTSGTTGPSKGVLITHNQGFFVASQYVSLLGVTKDDTGYCYIPLFHEAAQFGLVLGAMLYRGSFLLTRGFRRLISGSDIRKYNCTISGMFEAVIKILLMAPENPDDSENPMRIFATAHVTKESQKAFEKRFAVKLVNIYGLTEGDCTVAATYKDIRPGSFGKPRGYFDVELFDSMDKKVPCGRVGELVLRPRQPHIIFEGYYKMPEKTLEAFRNLWWHTGDLAYQDEDGYYYFVGREKDMIRRGDENVSALEVEKVIESHPCVKECAVVAAHSDVWGEEVKVVIVCREGFKIDPAEIIAYCDERMAYFMVPRYIEFMENIPRTAASGRPVKEELRNITQSTWDRVKAGVKIKRELKKHQKGSQ